MPEGAGDREVVERLERDWADAVAVRDAATLERLLAEDFTFTTPHRGTLARSEWLETTLERYVVEYHDFEELDVSVYGDAAVVRSRYRQRGSMDGARRDWTYLLTDVWVRGGSGWQVVARHSSPMPD